MYRFPLLTAMAAGSLATAAPLAAEPTPAISSALILKPLVLTKLDDLDWGAMLATGSGDWAKIDADTGARTFSNPAMNIASAPGKRARFASSGLDSSLVVLELAGPPALDGPGGDTVTVMAMTLDQNNKVLRRLTPTSQVFFVGIGGTVYIKPNQTEGVYTGNFTLTATYL